MSLGVMRPAANLGELGPGIAAVVEVGPGGAAVDAVLTGIPIGRTGTTRREWVAQPPAPAASIATATARISLWATGTVCRK
jgi:hypothetical protein